MTWKNFLLKRYSNFQRSPWPSRLKKAGQNASFATMFCLTGAFSLSALDDYFIYDQCSRKAVEIAVNDRTVKEALGEPISRGYWYSASLGLNQQAVTCTFPVVGPQGTATFHLKAFHNGGNRWFTFLDPSDFKLISLEALVKPSTIDSREHKFQINISEDSGVMQQNDCRECKNSDLPISNVSQKNIAEIAKI